MYEEVIDLSVKLNEDFNGSPQDIEGLKLASQSQSAMEEIEEDERVEEESLVVEAAKTAQDKAREIIRISNIWFDMNSSGGVDIYIDWTSNSEKSIKYVTFTATPYNSVGDEVLDHGKYDATSNLKSTGPFYMSGNYSHHWPLVWYNTTTDTFDLEMINVEYMDDTTVTLTGDDVGYVIY